MAFDRQMNLRVGLMFPEKALQRWLIADVDLAEAIVAESIKPVSASKFPAKLSLSTFKVLMPKFLIG